MHEEVQNLFCRYAAADADGPLRAAGELGSTDLDGAEDERQAMPPPPPVAVPVEETKPKKSHRRNRSLTALLPTLKAKPKRSTDEVSHPFFCDLPIQATCVQQHNRSLTALLPTLEATPNRST